MQIEYEATFLDINKSDIRQRLEKADAKLVRPEFLQKRVNFYPPDREKIKNSWLRVRDENGKITLSLKTNDGDKRMEDQKEACLEVNDFNDAVEFLKSLGCVQKSYQETKREIWEFDGVEISIDEWPFLEPFVEVEGKSEEEVKRASEKLGFDYKDALFCAAGKIYQMKYGIHPDEVNTMTKLVFEMENPFLNNQKTK